MKKQVIAYTHFHWDREWYKEYEKFRFRLLKSFDIVLDLLVQGKLPSFYFDGQTAAMLDYLEIYPEKEALIRRLVAQKKLFIGPFYCLVDEFLTSKEAFRKNLELGLKTSREFGCEDFVAYFADTFGHSACTIPVLKEFGIDKAVVWRGCGDIPSEFTWRYKKYEVDTVNLVRGYFNDVFAADWNLDKKVEFLKSNLDKIAEKSGDVLLLPIGADHLGVPVDLAEQISAVNERLDDYEIVLGSLFDYFERVESRFGDYVHEGELRDNSKTFILEGCYSSRLDIKRLNIIAGHRLAIAEKVSVYLSKDYGELINYAYRLLIQNQAHDSICGCSTDDVHKENVVRYKKILQISDSIIEEFRLEHSDEECLQVLNLGEGDYSGGLNFASERRLDLPVVGVRRGFPAKIFNDIYKIPVTEDYTDIYEYKLCCQSQKSGLCVANLVKEGDVFVDENTLGNSKILAQVKDGRLYVGDKSLDLVDFVDLGDSYNFGPKFDDGGVMAELKSVRVLSDSSLWGAIEVGYRLTSNEGQIEDIRVVVSLCAFDDKLRLDFDWVNSRKNHLLQICVDTGMAVRSTLSEDLGEIVEREFEPEYDVRSNLPDCKGVEVRMNNAPMQRGVSANGVVVVTQGITQYEIAGSELRLPLLRATGVISNAGNPARTTPAGPPIEVDDLQQLGRNRQSVWVGVGTDLRQQITDVYNECIVF